MKIKELKQHCGNCGIMEHCGNGFGYCLCHDERFWDMDEDEYGKIAETAKDIKPFGACEGCTRPDCGSYRYSETNYADDDCELADEAKDYFCEQVADYVERQLNRGSEQQ